MPNRLIPALLSQRRILIDIIAMLLIGLVVIVGYKLSPLLAPQADRRVAVDPGCNLHRAPCTVTLAGGTLEINLSPRPVPLLKTITLDVRAQGVAIRRIDADLAGIGMNMGFNRSQLLAVGAAEDGHYRAETSLPVCITGTMHWELTLMVDTGAEQLLIPIRFTTPEGGQES